MSFNEKLQSLRKENNLSQEALADMLDVTRQSVSKWESGTTYPEMDKLIMLCKIFKCSLDDLTNDEITEINTNKEGKNSSTNFLNNILEIINKTVHMFKSMTFKQMSTCILSLLILALILLLFKIPFQLIEEGIHSIIVPLISNIRIQKVVFGILCFILDMIYYALYILVYIYIYKIAFLDKYEFIDIKNSNLKKEEINIATEKIVSQPKITVNQNKENSLFKILGSLALACIKFFLFIFSLPSIFILILLLFLLVIDIYLMFNGIIFTGILLCLLSAILLVIWFLTLVSLFIFNKKISFKKMLIIFLSGLIGFGISSGLIALEISNFNYVSEAPTDAEKITEHFEKEMNETLYLNINDYYSNITFIEDNSKNNISIDINYYGKMYKFIPEDDERYIGFKMYYSNDFDRMKYLFDTFKNNLKEKVIYNYDEITYYNITITTSKENIKLIKENTKKINSSYSSCNRQLKQYQEEIDRLQEINDELRTEIEELETSKIECINE